MTTHKLLLTLITLSLTLSSVFNLSHAKQDPFCSDKILAYPIKNGYTWTLASRLGELLGMAEKEYGERDKDWTILGVEFNNQNRPKNWHPFDPKKKNIIIQLGKKAANNKKQMLFQLSHEVFHALSPTGGKDSNYLEEGLATYFSIKATEEIGVDITPDYIAMDRYRKAYDLVESVYKIHPNTGQRIADFRKHGNTISGINKKQIMIIFPNITEALASQLVRKF